MQCAKDRISCYQRKLEIKFLVLEILVLARRFTNITFYHMFQEVNFEVGSLANLGLSAYSFVV